MGKDDTKAGMTMVILYHIIALGIGVILDLFIGDPHSLPHPVRAIGKLIYFLEKRLLGEASGERNAGREKRRGVLLWFIVELSTVILAGLFTFAAYFVNAFVGVAIEAVLTCYIMAAGSLYRESMAVGAKLDKGDTVGARHALSMIVGRDTDPLSEDEITKAAVETVSENTSDGVIAPFLYTAVGGPVLGFFYKAVNTMDSMLGYKNERYENFGRFSAKTDDIFNFIPSRLSALFMIAGCFVLGSLFKGERVNGIFDGKRAFKVWRRDRNKHLSPNSAQTESACAGALGLRLGGAHLYHGVLVEKPFIGDELRKAETRDIKRAGMLMFAAEGAAWIAVFGALAVICAVAFAG